MGETDKPLHARTRRRRGRRRRRDGSSRCLGGGLGRRGRTLGRVLGNEK